jgi:hypothetical protein
LQDGLTLLRRAKSRISEQISTTDNNGRTTIKPFGVKTKIPPIQSFCFSFHIFRLNQLPCSNSGRFYFYMSEWSQGSLKQPCGLRRRDSSAFNRGAAAGHFCMSGVPENHAVFPCKLPMQEQCGCPS